MISSRIFQPKLLGQLLMLSVPMICIFSVSAQTAYRPSKHPPQTLLLVSDADCQLTVDGDPNTKRSLSDGVPYRLSVSMGDHILTCSTQGIAQNLEVNISIDDSAQKLFHINLASRLAAMEASKQQEAQMRATKNQEATDALLREQSILSNTSKMNGIWNCAKDSGLLVVDGRVAAYGTSPPMAGKVLMAIGSALIISFDAVDETTSTASGKATITYSSRLANQYEINGYQRPDRFQLSLVNPSVCFNSEHGSCVTSRSSKRIYDLDKVSEATESEVTIVLGTGTCTGDCSDDRVVSSGKKLTFTFKKDHPGFYWDQSYCHQ